MFFSVEILWQKLGKNKVKSINGLWRYLVRNCAFLVTHHRPTGRLLSGLGARPAPNPMDTVPDLRIACGQTHPPFRWSVVKVSTRR